MKKVLLAILALGVLAGCTAQSAPDLSGGDFGVKGMSYKAELVAQPVGPLNSDFVNGINDFGFSAAAYLYGSDNLALSPVSIELALAMTRAGAVGQTKEDMAAALKLSGLSDQQIADACRALMWRANTGGMEAANALWVGQGLTLSDEFAASCTDDFMADAYALQIPGAMDAINAWASEKTKGRINDIIEQELDPGIRMVLANALYFLGDWEEPFTADETYDEEFQSAAGGSVTAPFMHSTRALPYYDGDGFSIITLGFKGEEGGGQYAMAFLLPDEDSSVDALLASMSAEQFAQALSGAETRNAIVSLPKFEFAYFSSLRDMLMDAGMELAFSDGADFTAMTAEQTGLCIDDVLHKCFVKVDELGAEAAAVTVVEMRETAIMQIGRASCRERV
jgi:serine protease inhibitor